MSSLLFYYLFDDWVSIYYQAIGGEDSYRDKLHILRRNMEKSADVNHVTTLHTIGRELTVLRAVYRSYQSIVERIIQRSRRRGHHTMMHSLSNTEASDTVRLKDDPYTEIHMISSPDFQLAPSAVSRFERLLDRIGLCAMAEVEECLKEKDDLVMMVSNNIKPIQSLLRIPRVRLIEISRIST